MAGTYALVLLGPASVVIASLTPHLSSFEALVFVALVFGATVTSVIVGLGEHSGAHINPAVTLASLLSGGIERRLLAPYVAFQLAGGLLAGLA